VTLNNYYTWTDECYENVNNKFSDVIENVINILMIKDLFYTRVSVWIEAAIFRCFG